MNDIQNKVAIEELKNLKELLDRLCHDIEAYQSDWFDGRRSTYNIVIDYLQNRIDSLEKMA